MTLGNMREQGIRNAEQYSSLGVGLGDRRRGNRRLILIAERCHPPPNEAAVTNTSGAVLERGCGFLVTGQDEGS
jgi:hypothetical protein